MSLSAIETAHLMLALVLLLVAAHGIGGFFASRRQPRVIGEILAGLVLGPTLLGYIFPHAEKQIFPPHGAVTASLGAFYQIGLLLLLFSAGAEFGSIDPAH